MPSWISRSRAVIATSWSSAPAVEGFAEVVKDLQDRGIVEGKRLISVFPEDLPVLDNLLRTKLRRYGVTV